MEAIIEDEYIAVDGTAEEISTFVLALSQDEVTKEVPKKRKYTKRKKKFSRNGKTKV